MAPLQWLDLFEPKKPKEPSLAPPPEVEAKRAKWSADKRAQRAAAKHRRAAIDKGLVPPPKAPIGRPRINEGKLACEAVAPNTTMGRKRKAESVAPLAFTDVVPMPCIDLGVE